MLQSIRSCQSAATFNIIVNIQHGGCIRGTSLEAAIMFPYSWFSRDLFLLLGAEIKALWQPARWCTRITFGTSEDQEAKKCQIKGVKHSQWWKKWCFLPGNSDNSAPSNRDSFPCLDMSIKKSWFCRWYIKKVSILPCTNLRDWFISKGLAVLAQSKDIC